MSAVLEDIRVGDIVLCPDNVERKVEGLIGGLARVDDVRYVRFFDLRNPDFRVGDTVRLRGIDGTISLWQNEEYQGDARYALVKRAPVSDKVKQDKAGFIIEAWKQWPEHSDCGDCTAPGCGVCKLDKGDAFVKNDSGKPRMDLLPPKALLAVGRVLTKGAEKYPDHGWRKAEAEGQKRIAAAIIRHTLAALDGEEQDPESTESHWAHVAANALFLAELTQTDKVSK